MSKSNDSDAIMQRVVAAVKAANVPDYLISGMLSRLPKGKWPVNMAGDEPSRELFIIAALCKTNTAGCEAGFHTGAMREGGMSLRELSGAFDCGPAHNHSVSISQGTARRPGAGYFWREALGPSRWRMTITAKGEKYLMSKLTGVAAAVANAAAEKPAKAVKPVTGKAKAKKATKVAPTQTPTSEAPTVTVTPEANITPEVQPLTVEPEMTGGVEPEHDAVTPAELQGLVDHFNS